MNENEMQESLADVIAEGRGYKGIPVPYAPARAIWLDEFNSFLDRIEAAYKRDIEKLNSVIQATVSRSDAEIDRLRREVAELRKQIGNAAKLREAVEAISKAFDDALICTDYQMSAEEHDRLDAIYRQVKEALAAPARNCDVGTAKEQARRWAEFCTHHHKKMIGNKIPVGPCECPCYEGNSCNYFIWAQMPYESEVSHGNA